MAEMLHNPTPEELRAYTEEMPEARLSEFGNVNVQTRCCPAAPAARSWWTANPAARRCPRADYEKVAAMQDHYIAEHDMLVIDGCIGNDTGMRTRARLVMEKRYANIAGMQQKLYFARDDGAEPEVQVLYTPGPRRAGLPGRSRDRGRPGRRHDAGAGKSDYFGESKKGGLRMWNDIVYAKGGLALHAGLKVIPTRDGDKVFMIIGLSGTGKTTTTFTTQNGSQPIQDDFVGLMPGGTTSGTENGCFAKTFGLDPASSLRSTARSMKPSAYLENVYQDATDGSTSSTRTTRRTAARCSRCAICSRSRTRATSVRWTTC